MGYQCPASTQKIYQVYSLRYGLAIFKNGPCISGGAFRPPSRIRRVRLH
jgi:hypothetical protein